MGRWVSDEQQGLIAISVFLVITGSVPFLITDMKPLLVNDWLEAVYQIFLLSFIAVHVWTSTRGKRFGHVHTVAYVLSSGMMFAFIVILILKDVDSMYLEYEGEHAFSTSNWFLISLYLFIIPFSLSFVLFIFGERDLRYEERMIRLPVSRYNEWKDDSIPRVRPEEIKEIYPIWGITIKNKGRGFFKLPSYETKKKEGYGFRLRDGRRFGYEMTSRMILEEDLIEILGKTRFENLLADHSELDTKDINRLKEDISHWYTNQDGFTVISMLIALGIFMVLGILLTVLSDNISIWVPMVIAASIILFGWMIIGSGRNMRKWLFIKGTIFRMMDKDEKLPEWLEIKGTEFDLKK